MPEAGNFFPQDFAQGVLRLQQQLNERDQEMRLLKDQREQENALRSREVGVHESANERAWQTFDEQQKQLRLARRSQAFADFQEGKPAQFLPDDEIPTELTKPYKIEIPERDPITVTPRVFSFNDGSRMIFPEGHPRANHDVFKTMLESERLQAEARSFALRNQYTQSQVTLNLARARGIVKRGWEPTTAQAALLKGALSRFQDKIPPDRKLFESDPTPYLSETERKTYNQLRVAETAMALRDGKEDDLFDADDEFTPDKINSLLQQSANKSPTAPSPTAPAAPPQTTGPSLRLPSGAVLTDKNAIAEHLEKRIKEAGPSGLTPDEITLLNSLFSK